MARIAVDLDGVIASTLKDGVYPRDYPTKQPLPYSREGLEQLLAKGHTIFFFTARYEEDREITERWLSEHGYEGLYDELIMDKPKFDILIDDRALRHTNWPETLYKISELERKGVYHNDTSALNETLREEAMGSGRLVSSERQVRDEEVVY